MNQDTLYQKKNDNNLGKCLSCPSNCEECDIETSECLSCKEGYVIPVKEDGTSEGKCVSCPDNCELCNPLNINMCYYCSPEYGITEQGICFKCSDSHCLRCGLKEECYECKEGFSIDQYKNSPNYMKCVPSNYQKEEKCSVDNCAKCIYKNTDKCAQCNADYELDVYSKCVKSMSTISRDEYQPINVVIHDEIKDGICTLNVSSYDKINDNQVLNYQLKYNPKDAPNEIIIKNDEKKNIAFEIISGISELKVDSVEGSEKFDIIPASGSPLKLILGSSTRASIKKADGEVTIKGDKQVNLNKIYPNSNKFKLIPEVPIKIDKVDFNGTQSLLVENNKNLVEIANVDVLQKAAAKISNAKITGLVRFDLASSLEINDKVDLSSSTLEISYRDSQGFYDKAPINGQISSAPSSVVLKDGEEKTPKILAQDKFTIAESSKEFACGEWKINNQVTKTAIKEFEYVCSGQETDFSGNQVYRLYAQEKHKDKKKLSAGAIAGIVIGCVVVVGAVVFLLVYFLVIKKKKDNISSDQEADNDKDANEV